MKTLRCPRCGTSPVVDFSVPTGTDDAGFTTVRRIVECPACGQRLEGDPEDPAFASALVEWKVEFDPDP